MLSLDLSGEGDNLLLTAIAAVAFLASGVANDDQVEQDAVWKKQFAGFRSIAFHCSTNPETNAVATAICDNAAAQADYFASASKIPFYDGGRSSWFNFSFLRETKLPVGGIVTLELDITAAEGDGFQATTWRLALLDFYGDAVELTPDKRSVNDSNHPRSGDLELWSITPLSYGPTASQAEHINALVNSEIRDAFTLLLKYSSVGGLSK